MAKNKLLSVVLSLLMTAGGAAANMPTVYAEVSDYGKCGADLVCTITEDGVLTISGTGEMYDRYNTDYIYPWEKEEEKITKVIIEDGVTAIGEMAFGNCKNLKSVEIGNTVTEIGIYAFVNCTELENISIPKSVKRIGDFAFHGTKWHENRENDECIIVNDILVEALNAKGEFIVPENIRSISGAAFYATQVSSVKIPDSVKEIGGYAFWDCYSLKNVELPDSISSINYGTFKNCSQLEKITIPDSVAEIGGEAFNGCKKLDDIVIPETVDEFGNDVFYETKWLEEQKKISPIVVVNGFLVDGNSCSGAIKIPDTVKVVCNNAFCRCKWLTSAVLPNSVTKIGTGSFASNYLSEIVIMNPDCEIVEDERHPAPITNGFHILLGNAYSDDRIYEGIIYGLPDSTAQAYAEKNGCIFKHVDELPENIRCDLNGDRVFSVADIVQLDRWLLGAKNANIAIWQNGDLNADNVLDIFDLCLMRHEIVNDLKGN